MNPELIRNMRSGTLPSFLPEFWNCLHSVKRYKSSKMRPRDHFLRTSHEPDINSHSTFVPMIYYTLCPQPALEGLIKPEEMESPDIVLKK